MANAMQGIMALPGATRNMDQGSALPPPGAGPGGIDPSLIDPKTTAYARSNPEEFGQSMVDSLGESDPRLVYELRTSLAGMNLPPAVVDALLTMVDVLLQDPVNYAQNRQMFIDEGVPEEILPPNFDPIFLSGLQMALSETKRQPEVPKFARGGIVELKPIAKAMAQMGRGGDTMLAHITPGEARRLRVMGGSGTINPMTGLPEFGFFKSIAKAVTGTVKAVTNVVKDTAKAVGNVVSGAVDVVKSIAKPVVNVVKKIASSPIGKIALTVAAVYFMGPAGLNVAGTLGMTGATALGVNTALASTAVNLASGMSLKESLKGGAISGLTAGAVSAAFPSMLPASYQAAATPLAAPISAADYGASIDALDAANASTVQAAPSVAPGTPVSAVSGLESTNAIQPPSVPGLTAPGVTVPGIEAPSIATPQVQPIQLASAPGSSVTDVTSGVTGPVSTAPTVPSAFQTATDQAVTGNIPSSFGEVGTSGYGSAVPSAGEVSSGLSDAGYSTGTAANLAGETLAGTSATVPAQIEAPSLLDRGIGAIKSGYNTAMDYISPSRIQEAGVQGQYDAYNQALAATGDATLAREAFKAAAPGMLATYGPMAAVGTAALAASGAFTPKQPPPPGIVDSETMRTGAAPNPVNIGNVNTVTAPDIGYGSTSFYNTASGYSPAMGNFIAPQFQVRRPEDYLNLAFLNQRYAKGGIASLDKPRTYPRKTGAINGPGTGTSDSIPALLSDGEFVFTAKAVRAAGNGSRRAGAKRMYAMMKALERKANA